jgi:hypothetical protein
MSGGHILHDRHGDHRGGGLVDNALKPFLPDTIDVTSSCPT